MSISHSTSDHPASPLDEQPGHAPPGQEPPDHSPEPEPDPSESVAGEEDPGAALDLPWPDQAPTSPSAKPPAS